MGEHSQQGTLRPDTHLARLAASGTFHRLILFHILDLTTTVNGSSTARRQCTVHALSACTALGVLARKDKADSINSELARPPCTHPATMTAATDEDWHAGLILGGRDPTAREDPNLARPAALL
jgi:hypothetical protein